MKLFHVLVVLLATAAWAADKKEAPKPIGICTLSVDGTENCKPVLSDAQKVELLRAYKGQADAAIDSLGRQLQATQQLLQIEQRRRESAFDAALKNAYAGAGVKPEDWMLDVNTLEFTKVEKKVEEKSNVPPANSPVPVTK